jgi:hypothetical protein
LTVEPAVAEPVKCCVVAFVMSSVFDVPESSAVSRSGVDGDATDGTATASVPGVTEAQFVPMRA